MSYWRPGHDLNPCVLCEWSVIHYRSEMLLCAACAARVKDVFGEDVLGNSAECWVDTIVAAQKRVGSIGPVYPPFQMPLDDDG